jgi:hypothetical protein
MFRDQSIKQKRLLMADIGRGINRIGDKIIKIGNGRELPEAIPIIPDPVNISLLLPVQQIVGIETREKQTNVIN